VLLVSFDVAVNCYSFASCFVSLPEITVKRHKVHVGIVSETLSLVYSMNISAIVAWILKDPWMMLL